MGWILGIRGRVSLTTGSSGATDEEDGWSLGMEDGIEGSARMAHKNPREN